MYLIHASLGQPLETTWLIRTAGKLTFHDGDAARWDDFEQLFEATGSAKYCSC